MKKENKGITLIALVVTIIVLLILAGISIMMLTGQNGILNRAAEAKEQTGNSQIDEMVKISVMDALASGNGKITEALLTEALNKNLGSGNYTLTGNENEGWTIVANGKNYKVDANGTINKPDESIDESTTEVRNFSECTWEEINTLAKEIAKDNKITKDTEGVKKIINGKCYTATVGAKKTITINGENYIVRILGFNHDTLENGQLAYGDASITKAGISLEFETLLPSAKMNSSETNSGGWGASEMRTNLNRTTEVAEMINLSNIESVIGSNIIKSVTKSYIQTYNDTGSVTTCNDKLWLLSCSEIWDNGFNDNNKESGYDERITYGYAIASEGDQYKYYEDINAKWNLGNSELYKMSPEDVSGTGTSSSSGTGTITPLPKSWWLRSAAWGTSGTYYSNGYSGYFCDVNSDGKSDYLEANGTYYVSANPWVAPGFAV